jgi:cation diffusion facilitator CzcD-associated flavoprotein CzcO
MGRPKVFRWRTFYLEIYKWSADEYKVRDHIIYQQRASYNFDTREIMDGNYCKYCKAEETVYTCQFIFSCSGYYNYTKGYTPNLRIKPALKEK